MLKQRKRVCLLTGASGLLGTSFCQKYAHLYQIVGIYRTNPPRVASQHQHFINPFDPANSVPENTHPIFAVRADLGNDGELDRIVELALARFERIDLVIHAAVHSIWAPILYDRLVDHAETQFRINVLVPLKLTRLVAHRFWKQRAEENRQQNRNVINLSSSAGVYVYPDQGQSVYSASKAALNYLTWHMASEFWRMGVRVNAVAPNSFPSLVPTERVLEKMKHLDQGGDTGKIYVLDRDQEVVM
jgi:NAD(P)-dependent dehydrogenase (short-subunit alcohol dehydrogenase family)